ncbi:hypothetical protein [Saccharothrix deserti]|uniref:hypothetical protein n=1 Tax=Saccharothrix deserti TaxID=2593674 RepID=UPI00131AD46D|nr:hypothetical protein [Saccharothrix deserti]
MADERPQPDQRSLSEQQEGLERRRDTGRDRALRRDADAAAPQFTAPDGGGDFAHHEPTAIADEAGSTYPASPEEQAMHIETEEDRG